jgi:hypothetical protein
VKASASANGFSSVNACNETPTSSVVRSINLLGSRPVYRFFKKNNDEKEQKLAKYYLLEGLIAIRDT